MNNLSAILYRALVWTLLTIVVLCLAWCVAGCTPNPAVPPRVTQSAPAKAEDVSPAVSRVRGATVEIDKSAALAQASADAARREARTLREALGAATARADTLRKQEQTTKAEMQELWAELSEVTRRSLLLEDQAEATRAELQRQIGLRILQADEMAKLEVDARAKDTEAKQLAMQLADESRAADIHAHAAKENAEIAAVNKASADARKGMIRMLWVAIAVLSFLLLGACTVIYIRR